MPLKSRIETAMSNAIRSGQAGAAPPKLASALHYAVSPGGARIRPTICVSVGLACGDDKPGVIDAAATAIEASARRWGRSRADSPTWLWSPATTLVRKTRTRSTIWSRTREPPPRGGARCRPHPLVLPSAASDTRAGPSPIDELHAPCPVPLESTGRCAIDGAESGLMSNGFS